MGNPIIVALDCDQEEAYSLAHSLRDQVSWLKVGMTLYYQCGPQIVRDLVAKGFNVFVDLKLHDIPHQVRGASKALASLGAGMVTVHAQGGGEMLHAAVEGVALGAEEAGVSRPAVLAITVLTSMDPGTLESIGVTDSTENQVMRLAKLAWESGVDGVVCSPQEASAMRKLLGPEALIVTPGVRPSWANADDQSRIMTPFDALQAGASHLVIGRPITSAEDPRFATQEINLEIESFLQ